MNAFITARAHETRKNRGTRARLLVVAICTGAVLIAALAGPAIADPAHLAAYQKLQLGSGAVTLPIAAELEYRAGVAAFKEGRLDDAREHLDSAISLNPCHSSSYFTMARLCVRRFNPEAVWYAVQGVVVTLRSFDAQSTFAVNATLTFIFTFLLASAIVWLSLALRYLPFLAHRIAEALRNKTNASAARPCAYLLLLAPFLVFPSYAPAVALVLLATWPFMHRRERTFSFLLAGAVAGLLFAAPWVDRWSTVADPSSLTSLVARANESPADPNLARTLYAAETPGDNKELEAARQTALGLLAMRGGDQETAVAHYLQAIAMAPSHSIAYVNVGNVYYLNGEYTKALEGYRKAEQVDSTDAVGQYNLAQAYIKSLLMSESSEALERASRTGFDGIRDSFATAARAGWSIYPRIYRPADLWQLAAIEGRMKNPAVLSHAIASATGLPARTGFWIIVGAMVVALVVNRVVKRHRLAFQCSNCGEIACNNCCSEDHGSVVCQACAQAVHGVTSDKVLEALLRQRRQSVIVRRRKSIRWTTMWLPGVRHVYYGRFASGLAVASLFAGSVYALWTRGYAFPNWSSLPMATPLWMWILPVLGIVLSYAIAVMSRQLFEVRATRAMARSRSSDVSDSAQTA